MCGICKGLLITYVLLSLFLRNALSFSARIPLPTRLRRPTFPPGEG